MRGLMISAIILLLCSSTMQVSAEQNASPGINEAYEDANPLVWRSIFETEGREIWDRRMDILKALDLKSGMQVADVGAGTGFFSLMFAKKVGSQGRVYAVDITPNFVDAIMQRAADTGLENIVGVINDPYSVKLPENSIDLVFISDTYHHFEYPVSTLKSIHAALKPGGKLVIIDFRRVPGSSATWVNGHVRAGEDRVRNEIEAAGFDFVGSLGLMRTQYYLQFRKR